MLRIAQNMSELSFSELMRVYSESNRYNGEELYPDDSNDIQLRKAEDDFYHYLDSVFFRQEDARYFILEENGKYVAALRLEPYREGYLLCALETFPESRRKGYATLLIKLLQDYLSKQRDGIIISHVSKQNKSSLTVHHNCGFQIAKDYAVYLDGSVLHNTYTLEYKYKKTEI